MSQNADILEHLKSGRSLDPMQALELYRCFRLAARINDLREKHPEILTRDKELPSGKVVAEYYIPAKPQFSIEANGQLAFA